MILQKVKITNLSRPNSFPIPAIYHQDFWGKFIGLMFRKQFGLNDSILLDQKHDSRIGSAIHMLFMNFDIAAIWVNSQMQVIDVQRAHSWALAYVPCKPARYILETSIEYLDHFYPGDQILFDYE